jgi:hypothetical protein
VMLVRLTAGSVRARRRPGVVLALWAWEASLGVLLGSQVASVASGAYGRHPDGDAPLWAPGGLELLDLARHSLAARGPLLCGVLVVIVAARLLGLVPSAAIFAELLFTTRSRRAPSLRDALSLGVLALPASFTLEMFTLALQFATALVGLAVGAAASSWVTADAGVRAGDLATAAVGLVALGAATVVGVVGELARAAVVRWDAGAVVAARRALESFAARPVRWTASYAWRAMASWVPVAIGAWLAGRIGGRGGVALVVLAGFHQVVVLARGAIRASWMSRVLRGVQATRLNR